MYSFHFLSLIILILILYFQMYFYFIDLIESWFLYSVFGIIKYQNPIRPKCCSVCALVSFVFQSCWLWAAGTVATPTLPAGSCFDGRPVDLGDFSALRSQWQTQDKQLFMKWYEVICCLWVWPGWCFTADNSRPLASLSALRHRPPAH